MFWDLVKPGGYYIIEDVATGGERSGKYGGANERSGFATVAHNASGALQEIYRNNEVFFADTMTGVNVAHDGYSRELIKRHWLKDQVDHNSHLVVIRKRLRTGAAREIRGACHAA